MNLKILALKITVQVQVLTIEIPNSFPGALNNIKTSPCH